MIKTTSEPIGSSPAAPQFDLREQLVNQCKSGPVTQVSVPKDQVGVLHAIFIDIDIKLLKKGPGIPVLPANPTELYERYLAGWTSRHPILERAEIRDSGGGCHVLIWFDEPVHFETVNHRNRWECYVKTIQTMLPSDPDQPGICAMTRPIGSVNSKNGATVTALREGTPIDSEEIVAAFNDLQGHYFRIVHRNLFGSDHTSPCPVCKKEGTTLAALDRHGTCYGSCGTVQLNRLYDVFLTNRGIDGGAK